MAAPSAVNRQPWAFVVVDDRELLRELSGALPFAKMAAHAPLAVVVCGDLSRNPGASGDWWVMDASAASENLLLAAHALGLGAVWTGVYPRDERVEAVRRVLGLPADVVPLNLIPVGYPADNPAPSRSGIRPTSGITAGRSSSLPDDTGHPGPQGSGAFLSYIVRVPCGGGLCLRIGGRNLCAGSAMLRPGLRTGDFSSYIVSCAAQWGGRCRCPGSAWPPRRVAGREPECYPHQIALPTVP